MSGECDRCGEHCVECRCSPVGDDELVAWLSNAEIEATFVKMMGFYDNLGCCPAATITSADGDGLTMSLHFSADRARKFLSAKPTALQTRLERYREALEAARKGLCCPTCLDWCDSNPVCKQVDGVLG